MSFRQFGGNRRFPENHIIKTNTLATYNLIAKDTIELDGKITAPGLGELGGGSTPEHPYYITGGDPPAGPRYYKLCEIEAYSPGNFKINIIGNRGYSENEPTHAGGESIIYGVIGNNAPDPITDPHTGNIKGSFINYNTLVMIKDVKFVSKNLTTDIGFQPDEVPLGPYEVWALFDTFSLCNVYFYGHQNMNFTRFPNSFITEASGATYFDASGVKTGTLLSSFVDGDLGVGAVEPGAKVDVISQCTDVSFIDANAEYTMRLKNQNTEDASFSVVSFKMQSEAVDTSGVATKLGSSAIVLEPSGSSYAMNFYVKSGSGDITDAPQLSLTNDARVTTHCDLHVLGNIYADNFTPGGGGSGPDNTQLQSEIDALQLKDQTLTFSIEELENKIANDVLSISGGTMQGGISMNNQHAIGGLPDPSVDDQAANKKYVDDQIATVQGLSAEALIPLQQDISALELKDATLTFSIEELENKVANDVLSISGGTMLGEIDMATHGIIGLADPTHEQGAATKKYVDDQIAQVENNTDQDYLKLSGGVMTDSIDMSFNGSILHLPDPQYNSQAATKNYVDTQIASNQSGGSGGSAWATIIYSEVDTFADIGPASEETYTMTGSLSSSNTEYKYKENNVDLNIIVNDLDANASTATSGPPTNPHPWTSFKFTITYYDGSGTTLHTLLEKTITKSAGQQFFPAVQIKDLWFPVDNPTRDSGTPNTFNMIISDCTVASGAPPIGGFDYPYLGLNGSVQVIVKRFNTNVVDSDIFGTNFQWGKSGNNPIPPEPFFYYQQSETHPDNIEAIATEPLATQSFVSTQLSNHVTTSEYDNDKDGFSTVMLTDGTSISLPGDTSIMYQVDYVARGGGGGGGNGGSINSFDMDPGGGGGGSGYIETGSFYAQGGYTITYSIGNGGSATQHGGDTTISGLPYGQVGITALGGKAGLSGSYSGGGGAGGDGYEGGGGGGGGVLAGQYTGDVAGGSGSNGSNSNGTTSSATSGGNGGWSDINISGEGGDKMGDNNGGGGGGGHGGGDGGKGGKVGNNATIFGSGGGGGGGAASVKQGGSGKQGYVRLTLTPKS